MGRWVEPDIRDEVLCFVYDWKRKTGLSIRVFLRLIGLHESKFYDWGGRFRAPNQHNGKIPKSHWLRPDERQAILEYCSQHPDDGYRVLTYMMMDDKVVAVSPTTTYRVLSSAGLLRPWERKKSCKGTGFDQPSAPHEHWHIDISYLNILGTFYYLCSVLDGYSRYIVHWELRETMTERDVEIILERAIAHTGRAGDRLISDNGPQFIAKDFKSYLRLKGMKHVRTSPYYPQSNGKLERAQKTVKAEAIRKTVILSKEDAHDRLTEFITYYNEERLHAGIGYVSPRAKMRGEEQGIWDRRDTMLKEARQNRRHSKLEPDLCEAL